MRSWLMLKDFQEYLDKATYLSRVNKSYYDRDVDEVNIVAGYLAHVLDCCDSYCREVNKAIETLLPNSQREPQPAN